MNRVKELETKYLLDRSKKPEKVLRRLLQDLVWAGFHARPKSTRLIHDVYFDTIDQRLKHAGWSLRCRHRSLALQLTCKQLGRSAEGWFERREIEQTTLHDTPALANLEAGPVADLLHRYLTDNTPLGPLFSQDNRRTAYVVSHPDFHRSSIELVMDRVSVSGVPALRYVEFEAELKQGPTNLLAELATVMNAQPDLIQSRCSKFQRGLFNSRPVLSIGDRSRELMSPEDPWSRLCSSYLAEQFETLNAYQPFAWEGTNSEGVHQMRVATRRLRAALKTFGEVLPTEAATQLAREAGWICDLLGSVRDLDVHLEHVASYRKQLPISRHQCLADYEQYLKKDRLKSRHCLLSALESNRFRRFLANFQQLQQQINPAADGNPLSIHRMALNKVGPRLRKIRRAGRAIESNSPPEQYHQLRIRVKQLRYQLEILSGPYGGDLTRATRELRRLQNRLGKHQDACIAQAQLTSYRKQNVTGQRNRHTFDFLIRTEARRAASLRNRFQRDWAKFETESRKLKKVF